jgi:hypothetical protein
MPDDYFYVNGRHGIHISLFDHFHDSKSDRYLLDIFSQSFDVEEQTWQSIFHLGDYRRATIPFGEDMPDDYFYVNGRHGIPIIVAQVEDSGFDTEPSYQYISISL